MRILAILPYTRGKEYEMAPIEIYQCGVRESAAHRGESVWDDDRIVIETSASGRLDSR